MFRKKLLTGIALLAVIAGILAFTLPSKAEESLLGEEYLNATAQAEDTLDSKLPAAGVAATLKEGSDYESVRILAENTISASGSVNLEDLTVKVSGSLEEMETDALKEASEIDLENANVEESVEEQNQLQTASDLKAENDMNPNAVCLVADYIHLRQEASEFSETTGVFYHDAVGEIIGEENGWYLIKSGNVTGYIRTSLVATGEEAEEKIDDSVLTMATVKTDNLIVRTGPDKNAPGLEIVPGNVELNVVDQYGDWAKIETEEGFGYIYKPYTELDSRYITALTAEEITDQEKEDLRRAMEERALSAIAYNAANGQPSHFVSRDDSNEKGKEVAEFAMQFVGNPYVWGGTSLTDGCDCSGFVMSVYEQFGFQLTHSTEIDQTEGVGVESIEIAEAGDIICYQGHVAIYIGDGMIVHAAGEAKGIVISMACYDNILAVRRMFTE